MRLKVGDRRKHEDLGENESLPSDLSNDEWVEIVNFEKEKYEEDKRREKEEFEKRKKNLKEVLDKQLRDA